jgi:ketosteroid isomerase-like protein
MNEMFARAFNSRNIDNLLALYETSAVLRVDDSGRSITGLDAIADKLGGLMQGPGRMTSRNNFCVANGGLALLRADWEVAGDDGSIVASGSSAEIVRRQPDGTWLYVVDHATGASLPLVG